MNNTITITPNDFANYYGSYLKYWRDLDMIESDCNIPDNADENYFINNWEYVSKYIKPEPILSESSEKYSVFPIEYPTIWKLYRIQLENNWIVEDVDLSQDMNDWSKLPDADRRYLTYNIAYFVLADGLVNCNLYENVIRVIKIKEAECCYAKQAEVENMHNHMYSLIAETFPNREERETIFGALENFPSIKRKAEWSKKWIDCDKTFAHKIIANAIVEGIFFSSAFASIFWIKSVHGSILPGLRKANRFISRDENSHVITACCMKDTLKNTLREEVVYEMFDDAVEVESQFAKDALEEGLTGMNYELLIQYIKYCSDRLLIELGYNKKYNCENPFEFMKKIDLFSKANFFEIRNDAYSDGKIDTDRVFQLVDDY